MNKSMGWLMGYFVVMTPLNLALHHVSFVYALCHSIFGVSIAILIEAYNKYWVVDWK